MNNCIRLRMAEPEDAEELLKIYAPYVEKTAVSFEYEVPTVNEFKRRIEKTLESYPYIVAECNGEIAGYAYASKFKERAAYSWCAETSIYIKDGLRRLGIGRMLYEKLEEILKKQNVLNVNACIAYPNPSSIAFHEKLGFSEVAHFHNCGYKLGKWYDMVWMEKFIGSHDKKPDKIIPIEDIECGF